METTAAGRARALVSYATIQQRHVTWDNALAAHGLDPLGGRHTGAKTGPKGPSGKGMADEGDLRGDPRGIRRPRRPLHPTRLQRLARGRDRVRPAAATRTAELHTIWKRYGTWEHACDVALGEGDGQSSAAAAA